MKKTVLIFLSGILFLSCSDEKTASNSEPLQQQLDSLTTVVEKVQKRADSLQFTLNSIDSAQSAYPIFFGNKYEGIADPEQFIINQLKNQSDKIPMKAVHGGKMEFRKIDIISEKWLLAIYDDGHVQGKAIMEYNLQPDGSVKYTVVGTQK